MPWFSPWFARVKDVFRKKTPRSGKPQQTRPNLEPLERRDLFSLNVWLPQRLEVNSGDGADYFAYRLFVPTAPVLQPQFDTQNSSLSLSGSFTLTDTGSYDLSLFQGGPTTGGDHYQFWAAGSVSFTLAVEGQLTTTGLVPTGATLTQTAPLNWAFLLFDGSGQTLQSLGGTDNVAPTDTTVPDPLFWAGLNWKPLLQQVDADNSLGVSGLSADSFSLGETGNENYLLNLSDGTITASNSGTEPIANLGDTGSDNVANTNTANFSGTNQGADTFTYNDIGTYNGSAYALSSVAFSETGNNSTTYNENGTLTGSGTVAKSSSQAFSPSQNQQNASDNNGFTFSNPSTYGYGESSGGSYNLSEQGSFGGGSFSLGSLTYAGQGSGTQSLTLNTIETDNGSFADSQTGNGVNSFGNAGTVTDLSTVTDNGTFSQVLNTTRNESLTATYDRSIDGSYTGQAYQFSNFSLNLTGTGTFSLDQSGVATINSSGTTTDSSDNSDALSQGDGTNSSEDGTSGETYSDSANFTGQSVSPQSLNQTGNTSYNFTQIGSVVGGSVALSSLVYSVSENGSATFTKTTTGSDSGTDTATDQGSGTDVTSDTNANASDGGETDFTFSDNSVYAFNDNVSAQDTASGTFSNTNYRAGQFASGVWNLSSVVFDRSASSFGTTTSVDTRVNAGTETTSETDTGTDLSGLGYANTNYASSDNGTDVTNTTGQFSDDKVSNDAAAGTTSFSSHQEGIFSGFSYQFTKVTNYETQTALDTTVDLDSLTYSDNGSESATLSEFDGQTLSLNGNLVQGEGGTLTENVLDTLSDSGGDNSTDTTTDVRSENDYQGGIFAGGSYSLDSYVLNSNDSVAWSEKDNNTAAKSSLFSWSSVESDSLNAGSAGNEGIVGSTGGATGDTNDSSTASTVSTGSGNYSHFAAGIFSNGSFALNSVVDQSTENDAGTTTDSSTDGYDGTLFTNFQDDTTDTSNGSEDTGSEQESLTPSFNESTNQTILFNDTAQQFQSGNYALGIFNLDSLSYSTTSNQSTSLQATESTSDSGGFTYSDLQTNVPGGAAASFGGDLVTGGTTGTVQENGGSTFNSTSSNTYLETATNYAHQSGTGCFANFSYNLTSVSYDLQTNQTGTYQQYDTTNSTNTVSDSYTFWTLPPSNTGAPVMVRTGQANSTLILGSAATYNAYSKPVSIFHQDGIFANGSSNFANVLTSDSNTTTWTLNALDNSTGTSTDSWTATGSRANSIIYGTGSIVGLGQQSFTRQVVQTNTTTARETTTQGGTDYASLIQLGNFAGNSYAFANVAVLQSGSSSGTIQSYNKETSSVSGTDNSLGTVDFTGSDGPVPGGYAATGFFTVNGQGSFQHNNTNVSNLTTASTGSYQLAEAGNFVNGSYAFSSVYSFQGTNSPFTSQQYEMDDSNTSSFQEYNGAGCPVMIPGAVGFGGQVSSGATDYSTQSASNTGFDTTRQVQYGVYAFGSFSYDSMVFDSTGQSQGTSQQSDINTFQFSAQNSFSVEGEQPTLATSPTVVNGQDSFAYNSASSINWFGGETTDLEEYPTASFSNHQEGSFSNGTWNLSSVVNSTTDHGFSTQHQESALNSSSSQSWSLNTLSTGDAAWGYGPATYTAYSTNSSALSDVNNSTLDGRAFTDATNVQEGAFSNGAFTFNYFSNQSEEYSRATYSETDHFTSAQTATSGFNLLALSNASFSQGAGSFSAQQSTTNLNSASDDRLVQRYARSRQYENEVGNLVTGAWNLSSISYDTSNVVTSVLQETTTLGTANAQDSGATASINADNALSPLYGTPGTYLEYFSQQTNNLSATSSMTQAVQQLSITSISLSEQDGTYTPGDGYNFGSVVYQNSQNSTTTTVLSGVVTGNAATSQQSVNDGTTILVGYLGPGYYTPGFFGHQGLLRGSSQSVIQANGSTVNTDSFTLYEAGAFTGSDYALSSVAFDEQQTSRGRTLQTATSHDFGHLNAVDTAFSDDGTLLAGTHNLSHEDVVQAQVLDQTARATYTLHQTGQYTFPNGSGQWVLDSVVYDQQGFSSFTLNDSRVTISKNVQQQRSNTIGVLLARDLTTSLLGVNTFTLESSGGLSYTDHRAGTLTGNTMSLSCYVFDGVSSATQSLTYSSLYTAGATGSATATIVLGANSPFIGAASVTDNSWQVGTVTDNRSFTLVMHDEGYGGGPPRPFTITSSLVTYQSNDYLTLSQAGMDTLTTTGASATDTTSTFNDTATTSFNSQVAQQATNSQAYGGAFTSDPENTTWELNATAYASFSGTKQSSECWTSQGFGSGNDSFLAKGNGQGMYSLSANGVGNVMDYDFDGSSSGCFSQRESGFDGAASFSHNRDWVGNTALHADGTNDPNTGNSANSYLFTQNSMATVADMAGSNVSEQDVSTNNIVAGSGDSGVGTWSSQYTYTQGSSEETGSSLVTGTQPLSAPPLTVPVPPYLVPQGVFAPPVDGTGHAGEVLPAGLGGPAGLVAGRPGAPVVLFKPNAVFSADSAWRLSLLFQVQVFVSLQAQPLPGTPESAWLETDNGGSSGLPSNIWLPWSWYGGAAQAWVGSNGGLGWPGISGSYDLAYQALQGAGRTGDPMAMASTQAWEWFVSHPPPGTTVTLDQWRRSVEVQVGVANTLSNGLFLRGWNVMVNQVLPHQGLVGFISTQSNDYQTGVLIGRATIIASMILGGPLGVLMAALHLAGSGVDVVEAVQQGRTVDAQAMAQNAFWDFVAQVGPCAIGLVSGRLGRAAAQLVGMNQSVGLMGQGLRRIGGGDVAHGVLDAVEGMAMFNQSFRSCFPAGTKLLTEGGLKAVENITLEDRLLSRHEEEPNGPLEYKRVLQTFVRVAAIIEVRVAGVVIRTTTEHPFYVLWEGWTPAEFLKEGDHLVSHDGQLLVVEGVTDRGEVTTVYNFEVEDYHTYFVGGETWLFSIWVHNAWYQVINDKFRAGYNAIFGKKKKGNTNKFKNDQLDPYARRYAEYINNNREPDWNVIAPGLSTRQIRNIRNYARQQGYVTPVPVNQQGHADFTGHYYILNGIPLDNVPLPKNKWGLHYTNQFKYLNRLMFNTENTPTGYVWHHHQDPGRMQLVRLGVHLITQHNGGREAGWAR